MKSEVYCVKLLEKNKEKANSKSKNTLSSNLVLQKDYENQSNNHTSQSKKNNNKCGITRYSSATTTTTNTRSSNTFIFNSHESFYLIKTLYYQLIMKLITLSVYSWKKQLKKSCQNTNVTIPEYQTTKQSLQQQMPSIHT